MEKIIVSLTTWPRRVDNLPNVILSVLDQTHQPDLIRINLSKEEFPFPWKVAEPLKKYCDKFSIPMEIKCYEGNTKVWKKFIPTLQDYPNDCVICIDDDILYPDDFIETLYNAHLQHPNNPIGSMCVVRHGAIQHCGCGTLDKAEFYDDMLNQQPPTHLRSSDTYYNYWAQRSGHPVIWCGKTIKFTPFNEVNPWNTNRDDHQKMWDYCVNTYGPVVINRPQVFYFVPWSPIKNLGHAYNTYAKLVPNDAYICFVDADTIFTTSDYGTLIEDVLTAYPDVEAFTCKTNRVGCHWQIAQRSDWVDDDMRHHRELGEWYKAKNGLKCIDRTNEHLFSGLFLVIKKSAWDAIGGAPEDGMLGIDNAIHQRLRDHGMRLYQMMGLYLYHWYRGGDRHYTKHLQQ